MTCDKAMREASRRLVDPLDAADTTSPHTGELHNPMRCA
jgi:hypothetical protein